MSKRLLVLGASLAAAAALVGASALAGASPSNIGSPQLHALTDVKFISVRKFSHPRSDDPIVFFRHPNLSHDHEFFGATTTNAYSTPNTLRVSPTTCDRTDDTAAYWAPTVLLHNQPVIPIEAWAWYRRNTIEPVRAYPPGLKIVAGNSHATSPQSTNVVFWNCSNDEVSPSVAIPTCPDDTANSLRVHVHFPDCWDGQHTDSPNHKSHMAYSVRGRCPAAHPVAVPALTVVIQYPITGGPGVTLSAMNSKLTGHADFVNAWQQAGLNRLVQFCLNALRTCGHAD